MMILKTINFKTEQENIFQYLRMSWCNSDIQIVYTVVLLQASSQIHLNQKPVFHPKILQLKWPRKASLLKQSKWNSRSETNQQKLVMCVNNTQFFSCFVCVCQICPSISFPKTQGVEQIHLAEGWKKHNFLLPEHDHSCTNSFPLHVLLGMLSCKEDKSPAD